MATAFVDHTCCCISALFCNHCPHELSASSNVDRFRLVVVVRGASVVPPPLPPTARSFILPSLVNHLSYHNTDRLRDGLTSSNINRYQLQLRVKEAPTEQEREGRPRRGGEPDQRTKAGNKEARNERASECEERAAAASHALHGNHCDACNSHGGGAGASTFRVKL